MQTIRLRPSRKEWTMPANKLKTKNLKPKIAKQIRATGKTSGFSLPVYSLAGTKKGTITLPKEVFGAKVNNKLMAQAVRVYLVNQRQGTASTKTRGEVRGSTRKIYRQKGTGRARHGAITAPIFVGGGITFGPRPRKFELKMSKQMRRKALLSALSQKLSEDRIRVVDVNGASGKTKQIYGMLKVLELINKKREGKILFVVSSAETKRGVRNIESVEVSPATSMNTYVVLNNNHLVFAKEAIGELENLFKKN